MAKFKGDYYMISLDEREVGGKLTEMVRFNDWKMATAAWGAMPEPEEGCIWLSKHNYNEPDYDEAIACKGPDKDPLYSAFVEELEARVATGEFKVKGKKSTRH